MFSMSSKLVAAVFFAGTLATQSASGASSQSTYDSLTADVLISSPTQAVITRSLTLSSTQWVFVESDGRYYVNGGEAANVYITIDGIKVSNDSLIDYRGNQNFPQHSFNAIGAAQLAAGVHTIKLVGQQISGNFNIGAASNLSVVVAPASTVSVKAVGSDLGPFNFTTASVAVGSPVPNSVLLSTSLAPSNQSIVALASGRAFRSHGGDAMFGIYVNGVNPGNNVSTWSDNDLGDVAPNAPENQAPLFNQAFLSPRSGNTTVSLIATEFPWGSGMENPVVYYVGAGTRLVSLLGGMTVAGSAILSSKVNNWEDYICIGSSQGWPFCPAANTDVVLASSVINIPAGHNGIVLFTAKTRAQGDPSDPTGLVTLSISIDGRTYSSVGIQQLNAPDVPSQRTICSSVLTAGSHALASGNHTVQVHTKAAGNFIHMSALKDVPLIWFD